MRRRKKPGSVEKLLAYTNLLCANPEKYKGNWSSYFSLTQPIHVELGTGRGQFITTLAEQNPHINYIGVEIKEEVLLKAVEKAAKLELRNIAFLWFDINKIEEVFDEGELERIFINFCDPWPKKRWTKRRLTHSNFLEKYKGILNVNGQIHFKTDNEGLFEFSLNEMSSSNLILSNITFNLHKDTNQHIVTTEYEDKFTSMGMRIYRCEASKRL